GRPRGFVGVAHPVRLGPRGEAPPGDGPAVAPGAAAERGRVRSGREAAMPLLKIVRLDPKTLRRILHRIEKHGASAKGASGSSRRGSRRSPARRRSGEVRPDLLK